MAFLNVLLLVSLVAAAATGSEVNRTFCQTGRYEDIPLIEVKTGETLCIMTKNYPADYKKKQNSRLTIKHMDPNAHLEVIMEKGLTMEMKYGQCRDSLMVNTGARGDMDKMCDAVEPFNKVSVGNTAIIQFISNSNRVAAGSGGIKICLRAVGEWGDWGEWSLCSESCKGGNTTRTRDCIGDFPCAEEDGSEMMDCNENIPCIVNGEWGEWGEWGTCSVDCGDGLEEKTRFCDNPAPEGIGGLECVGEATANQTCVTGVPCPDCSSASGSGIYPLKFGLMSSIVETQCTSDGWTVILSRGQFENPVNYFDKGWTHYVAGFGVAGKEHWLGLDAMHALTSQGSYSLRVKMTAADGTSAVANYASFSIDDATDNYRLSISGYSGTAGDSITGSRSHNGMKFTTKDKDNDIAAGNCANLMDSGGWWYRSCFKARLTGSNLNGASKSTHGIIWGSFKGFKNSLQTVEMAVKIIS